MRHGNNCPTRQNPFEQLREPSAPPDPLFLDHIQGHLARLHSDLGNLLETAINHCNSGESPLYMNGSLSRLIVQLGEAQRRTQYAQPFALELAAIKANGADLAKLPVDNRALQRLASHAEAKGGERP